MKIPNSKYDIILEGCCLLCLMGAFLYLVITWSSIPDQTPIHYNAMGEIDRVAGKTTLLILFAVTGLMYIGMSLLERYPQIWNTGVAITEENKERVYRILKGMMKTVKMIIVAGFTYITINSATARPLAPWFTPVFLILIVGSLIFFTVKLFKNEFPKS